MQLRKLRADLLEKTSIPVEIKPLGENENPLYRLLNKEANRIPIAPVVERILGHLGVEPERRPEKKATYTLRPCPVRRAE